MRIAIVGPFFFPQLDGVEKVMLNHARHLVRRGHEVHVVTSFLRYPTGRFERVPAREEMEGFTIHRLPVRVAKPNWRFAYLNNGGLVIQGLVATLRRIGPDVLHAHQIAAPAWAFGAAWYAWTRRRRFFYSPHYHPDMQPGQEGQYRLLHGLNALPIGIARRIFHLTRVDHAPFLAEYPKARPDRLAVLPNGVDPPRDLPRPVRPPEEAVFLFVGRVDEHRKGFDLLRTAFARLRRPGWRLDVIGRISDATRASLAAEFGDAVRVLGLVDEGSLEAAYAEADVFVMPSRYEGFGMPFIEAMRYGVPAIGTAIGGVPEVVPEGTGLLIPLNDVDALTAAMRRLGESPAERAAMGTAGKAWSARFLWEEIVAGLEQDYRTA
ncbi:glycosyltransferase family 4 protein [Falsiroseomonas bella]|uniref:glycosyltransferase family 4 protein n=1 Tax=Falsiroseomonas bella TaxID=2184016 RepID=UPI001304F1D7|nr:glycosyltransferase family 4 protein [Falsiroseomonas bella]